MSGHADALAEGLSAGEAAGTAAVSVCMLTNLFPPVASGSSTQSMGLSRALKALGCDVVVITARIDPDSPEYEVIEGIHVYRLKAIKLPKMAISLNFPWLNWTLWPKNLRRIEEILRRHAVNMLHVHNHMFDMAFAGVMMRKRLGLPMALTIHTVIRHSIGIFNLLLTPADAVFLKHAVMNKADAVICPDVNIEAYARTRFKVPEPALIPYGISLPPDPGPAVRSEIVERFGLAGKRVILSLGHVHALRNRIDLVKAMPRVREAFPDAVLLIVGAVADQRPVALVKELGLEDCVIFTGPQPHAHMSVYHDLAEIEAMWFDQADGGMNPLGIACMESMYAGNPVITVSNEDTFGKGVIKSGRDVMIIKARQPDVVADIVIDLLGDDAKRNAMGASAKAVATQMFAWPSIARRTLATYRAAMSRVGSQKPVVTAAEGIRG